MTTQIDSNLVISRSQPGVVRLTLNRPEQHNALDSELITALHSSLLQLREDSSCRVVVLEGAGRSFCAGADLRAMRDLGSAATATNEADAQLLAQLLLTLHHLPQPTVALVRGAAMGGGLGLVAACDLVLCADSANFSFPELRLGLMPAVISPYVCAAIGQRATRALFLTSERFDAVAALRLGLVHRTCADEHLESEGSDLVMTLLNQGPAALGQLKLFLQHVASHPIDQPLAVWTARHLARLRSSTEAQEGMLAAIERRKPRWST